MAIISPSTNMAMALKVIVPPHPLISHWITVLRASETPSPLYATGLEEIGRWLTYEAMRDWLPSRQETVNSSEGQTEGWVIESNVPLLALPLLPSGYELWQGARNVLPNAELCLNGIPKSIEDKAGIILFATQIASGKKLIKALKELYSLGLEAKRLRVITALVSKPGLQQVGDSYPDLTIHTACIDPDLSQENVIRPGIGNPISRLNTRF